MLCASATRFGRGLPGVYTGGFNGLTGSIWISTGICTITGELRRLYQALTETTSLLFPGSVNLLCDDELSQTRLHTRISPTDYTLHMLIKTASNLPFRLSIMSLRSTDHRKTAPSGAHVSLIADGEAHRLYSQFGFRPTAPESIAMAFYIE
jgi:hypothetical protein